MGVAGFIAKVAASGIVFLLSAVPLACFANTPLIGGLDPEKIVIEDAFDRQQVNVENVVAAMHRCMPDHKHSFSINHLKIPTPKGQGWMVSASGIANYFSVEGWQGACIKETTRGFPVLPAEAFANRATFSGVAATVQQEWFRRLAKAFATNGKAELAVTNASGGTHVLSFGVGDVVKETLAVGRRFFPPERLRAAANSNAIIVTAPEMTGIVMLEGRARAGAMPTAHNVTLMLPAFFDDSLSEADIPHEPIRVERSALTGLPLASKP